MKVDRRVVWIWMAEGRRNKKRSDGERERRK